MPWGDRTGPWGLGPMTGRAAGYCAGLPAPGFMNPLPGRFGWGRGFGRGFGFGRGHGFGRGFGWRRWMWNYPSYPVQPIVPVQIQPQITKEQELQYMETERQETEGEISALKEDVKEILKRIEELKRKK